MITVLLILLTLVWCAVAFGLFVGADNLVARMRSAQPTFDWFDRTRWSGRSTRGKRAAVSVMTFLAGAAMVLALLALIGVLLDLAGVLPEPRPPARPR